MSEEDARDALVGEWPVIQGTSNQLKLMRIGKMDFDMEGVKRSVDAILNEDNTASQPPSGSEVS